MNQFMPILTFLGGFAGLWLASRFAAQRAHEDKSWLRKADAYGKILEALADIRDWYAVYLDDVFEDRDASPEQEKERRDLLVQAKRQLAATVSREVWLLPDSVKEVTNRMNKEFAAHHESWQEYLDHCQYHAQGAQTEIENIAKTDLERPSFWSFW